jgi:hypothetical protein
MSIVLQGSTSGSVTLQEPAVAGTTVLDLPAVSGTILTTGSSGQSIPKAALPTGSVLQVVSATYSTEATNNTDTYADTGLSLAITPTSSSSKILVLANNTVSKFGSNTQSGVHLNIVRGSTQIVQFAVLIGYTSATGTNVGSAGVCYLDSPATTSSTTYKMQFKNGGANAGGVHAQESGATSTIVLMEIAA